MEVLDLKLSAANVIKGTLGEGAHAMVYLINHQKDCGVLVSKDQPWFNALEKKSSKKVYAPEDPINFQGELSEHVGLILSGTAKAVSYSENGCLLYTSPSPRDRG